MYHQEGEVWEHRLRREIQVQARSLWVGQLGKECGSERGAPS